MIEIETTDIKASSTVSRILWTLLDVIYAGDDTEDMQGFNDKLLLEDVLRFGTIAEVARLKGGNYSWWKIQSELTPRANVSLTPENFLILTP